MKRIVLVLTAWVGFANAQISPLNAPPSCNNPPCLISYVPPPPLINWIGVKDTGIVGNQLTISGRGLAGATAVRFGGRPAYGFLVLNDSSIAVWPPLGGLAPGSTVPVTAVVNGQTVASTATYSTPIATLDVTGPLPWDPDDIWDMPWYNGAGHHFFLGSPGTLTFAAASPTIHITADFIDDSYAHPESLKPPYALGNEGKYTAWLEMCDVTVLNGPEGSCKNFDGNTGSWVVVSKEELTLPSAGWGQTAVGDLAIPTGYEFNQANMARTFRLRLGLQQLDTNNSSAQGDRTDGRVSDPFHAVVIPAALIELNVIPQTILYHPPGNQSFVSFSTEATYGTNFTLGNSTETSNKRTDEQSTQTKFSVNVGFGGFGFNGGPTSKWDHTVSEGFGTTAGSTSGGSSTLGFKGTWGTIADQRLIPGSGDTCGSPTNCPRSTIRHDPNIVSEEPFWEDTFILLVHPQFAVWVEGNSHDRYVMYGAVPVTANVTVAELAACANGILLVGQDPCVVEYSDTGLTSPNGKAIYYTGSTHTVTLTYKDASSLLNLDPFYEGGQGAQIDVTRAIPVASIAYGAKVGEQPLTYSETLNNTQAAMQGQSKGTKHSTSVVDMIGNTSSEGVSVNKTSSDEGSGLTVVVGENLTFTDTDNTSFEQDMTATFTDSTAVSGQITTTAQVTLNDVDNTTPGNGGKLCPICHDPLPQWPRVNILLDRNFGSLMFQDPDAPAWAGAPLPAAQLRSKVLEVATLQEQSRQRFSDVSNDSPAKAAIGLLARTQVMQGLPDGTFRPDAPLTRGQLATMVAKALHLAPTAGSGTFPDVSPDDPNAAFMAAAVEAGLLVTPSEGMLGANDPVSRQEMAATLVRAFKLAAPSGPHYSFRDEQHIASWAATGVQGVATAGYIPGFPDGTWRPAEPITRASAALALLKVLQAQQ